MHLNKYLCYCLLLFTCLALLSIALTGSESPRRGQRRVIENFDQDLEDETDPYISENELDSQLGQDQSESTEETELDNDATWNEDEGSDKDEKEGTEGEGEME